MAYSVDLRKKAMKYLREGHSKRETARVFGVSKQAISDWEKLQNATGRLEKKELKRSAKKLPPEKLTKYIKEHPDAYLKEIAEVFHCTEEAVRKALLKLDITRKKRQSSFGNETKSSEKSSSKR